MFTEIALDKTFLFLFDLTWSKRERFLRLSIFIYFIFLSSFFLFLLVPIFIFLIYLSFTEEVFYFKIDSNFHQIIQLCLRY